MESRAFIKYAKQLVKKIELNEAEERRGDVQKEINQLFAGLQNPSLPSAYELRDVALKHGYNVDSKVQHRLTTLEHI
jgi:septation ring formation regulator EzrA